MAGLATLQGWRFQELVELPMRGMMQPSCPIFLGRKQIRRRHAPPPFLHANPRPRSTPARNGRLFLDAGIGGLPGAFVEAGKYPGIHLLSSYHIDHDPPR